MSASKYLRKHGKLTERISVPVDAYLKALEMKAKDSKFNFNAWVRDLLTSNAAQVIEAAGLKIDEE